MVAVTPRLQLENRLSKTTTTVTEFLEHLVGEPVDALERNHLMTKARMPNLLGLEEGHCLLARSTVLRGRTSGQSYLHAESLLVPSRLPPGFCDQLKTSTDPIGRILGRYGIEFTRTLLPSPEPEQASVFSGVRVPDEHLYARTYRVAIDGEPAMVISEWFLPALERFLSAC
jgi:chorismate--pyruvate lyase